MPLELKERAKMQAAREGLTLSQFVFDCIEEHIIRENKLKEYTSNN